MENTETPTRVPDFKEVAHHYLTAKVRIKIYRVGKTYTDGEFEASTTLNYTHLELMKGGQYVLVPELKDWRDMTDEQVIEMLNALDHGSGERIHDFGIFHDIKVSRDHKEIRAYIVPESGESFTLACTFIDMQDCSDYLRDRGYDVHGLVAAGKAVGV